MIQFYRKRAEKIRAKAMLSAQSSAPARKVHKHISVLLWIP